MEHISHTIITAVLHIKLLRFSPTTAVGFRVPLQFLVLFEWISERKGIRPATNFAVYTYTLVLQTYHGPMRSTSGVEAWINNQSDSYRLWYSQPMSMPLRRKKSKSAFISFCLSIDAKGKRRNFSNTNSPGRLCVCGRSAIRRELSTPTTVSYQNWKLTFLILFRYVLYSAPGPRLRDAIAHLDDTIWYDMIWYMICFAAVAEIQ